MKSKISDKAVDVAVIGGGINGAGIARDLAGRGFSVLLCEKDDLASHTSSSSTKLIHGGLRYLEQMEFALVRKALAEREVTDRHFNHMRPSIAPQNSLRTTGISSQSHSGALVGSAAAKKSVVQENDFHRAGCARHRDTPQSACLTTLACHQLIR